MPGRVHRKHIGCTCFQVWTPTASQLSVLIMLPSESFLFIHGEACQTFLFFQEWKTLLYRRLRQHLIRKGLRVNSTASCPRGLLSLEVRQVLVSSFSHWGSPVPREQETSLPSHGQPFKGKAEAPKGKSAAFLPPAFFPRWPQLCRTS